MIINQKRSIKIGTCYSSAKKDGNYACVRCMVLLYSRETEDWEEAPMGEHFLKNAYDFYQASEDSFWESKDLSMMIAYDYKRIEKYSLK